MKTVQKTILFLLLVLYGCEGILEKDPIAILDAGSFFQSEADAEQAVNAAYNPLLFSNGNNNFYWAFAEITTNSSIPGGDGSRPGIVQLESFTYTPRTEEFNNYWQLQYKGITQANLVLDNIESIEGRQEFRNRIKGEALFLRSYYYFNLVQVFGDVPLYLNIKSPEELKIARTSKAEIYKQIIADCIIAAELLPIVQINQNLGRVTKGAALALAAKTSLYIKDYSGALVLINQIKALGIYQLVENYGDNFGKLSQNNSESVWEIQHSNLELGVGNFLNQWWSSKKFQGYGFAEVTPEFVAEFETNDPRLGFTVAKNNDPYFGLVYKNSFSTTKYSPIKYLQSDEGLTQKADGDINYTAIRYAEILLWEAEALTELGKIVEAQAPLEEVRARARAQSIDSTSLPMINTSNQEEMRLAVRHERMVELGFEMHRFFDLVRWGIAKDLLPGFQSGKHDLFPLPQTEMDLNSLLVQNPGY